MKKRWSILLISCMLISCKAQENPTTVSGLQPSNFSATVQGKPTALYVLKNRNGMEACVTNYGARLVSLMVPNRDERMINVNLGHDSIGKYVNSWDVFGAVIGQYANRIGKGTFTIDGVTYELPHRGDGPALHGGTIKYQYRVWEGRQVDQQTAELHYLAADGEANFPGNLNVKVTYKLTDDNALSLTYEATTDKPTILNLTNHSYFTLSDKPGSKVLDYEVTILADHYTPTDHHQVPTGEIAPVDDTPFDLRHPIAIKERLNSPHEQMELTQGEFDHNFVLNSQGNIQLLAAKVYNPDSGIAMEVYTTEPGMQFYVSPSKDSFCLETQHYPDSPNKPNFPSTELRPEEKFFSQTIYKFGVE